MYSCFPWPLALCLHHTMIFRVLFRQLRVICICMNADVVFTNALASSDLMFIVCLFEVLDMEFQGSHMLDKHATSAMYQRPI